MLLNQQLTAGFFALSNKVASTVAGSAYAALSQSLFERHQDQSISLSRPDQARSLAIEKTPTFSPRLFETGDS
ncbi:hypothetical protein I542_3837 [Mycobacteroides abscessus 1948]|uniref:Uncharacterized protein n=1 Tax=Mycobacteroides abscessus 1948 TaxID=1299323 RepID=A0A829QM04_9MYCO|nr:hypothetical protein [Mycobacteroides abscessus]EIV20722.1 hypothetical protein MA3A0119R_5221 [Mycobacteroides abscessus 3A-0119-R]EIV21998.1 hypothetical protein MA3A0122R_5329 [Mycobacteroides abscessus 3A-0122-R]EIV32142.1 hypothetical protein MA3A0122S_5079 [Mycobacteroides abscessus 3A-0122-S]EIV34510.1 hypothetical protein MA3A0731_5306 [Mycobacteroides abscessus 3A-0731]EIV44617.1 hypothetical protein MA3A0930R_5239 [Mycobacteroides abscessus 3A-0930-R]EIV45967.1 hypothetical prote